MSFLVGDNSSSSSTDDFDNVSRIEVFVSSSVLIMLFFLISSFCKKTFFEAFYLIFQFLSRHSNTQTKISFLSNIRDFTFYITFNCGKLCFYSLRSLIST